MSDDLSRNGEGWLRRFASILALDGRIEVVDVGANPIEGTAPYQSLIDARLCQVTAFEPQTETMASAASARDIRTLPWAVGDGRAIRFNTCAHSGWSSALEPDRETLSVFTQYQRNATVVVSSELATRRLDDLAEIKTIDYLKIDVQGSELAVLANGQNKLSKALFVHTEVSFVPIYEKQPTLGDVDNELRRQGFLPHCFGGIKKAIIPPLLLDGDPWKAVNQLLDGDMIYVRDFRRLDTLSETQLKAMALIGHGCYGSWDLAYRNVLELERRKAISAGSADGYLRIVNSILRGRAK